MPPIPENSNFVLKADAKGLVLNNLFSFNLFGNESQDDTTSIDQDSGPAIGWQTADFGKLGADLFEPVYVFESTDDSGIVSLALLLHTSDLDTSKWLQAFPSEKGFEVLPSGVVVSINEPTPLLSNAGMIRVKDYFIFTTSKEYAEELKVLIAQKSGSHTSLLGRGSEFWFQDKEILFWGKLPKFNPLQGSNLTSIPALSNIANQLPSSDNVKLEIVASISSGVLSADFQFYEEGTEKNNIDRFISTENQLDIDNYMNCKSKEGTVDEQLPFTYGNINVKEITSALQANEQSRMVLAVLAFIGLSPKTLDQGLLTGGFLSYQNQHSNRQKNDTVSYSTYVFQIGNQALADSLINKLENASALSRIGTTEYQIPMFGSLKLKAECGYLSFTTDATFSDTYPKISGLSSGIVAQGVIPFRSKNKPSDSKEIDWAYELSITPTPEDNTFLKTKLRIDFNGKKEKRPWYDFFS